MARKLPIAIDPEEFKELLKPAKPKFRVAFLLGFGSGMRLSEIVGGIRKDGSIIEALTKERVNIEGKQIFVAEGKGNKDRIVPLAKGFKESHLSLLPLNKEYKNIKSARRSMQKTFKLCAEKAGLLEKKPTLHFHSLRHGFGSQLARTGVPIHHIRTMMGHASISTTNVYLEANPTQALKAYEEMF